MRRDRERARKKKEILQQAPRQTHALLAGVINSDRTRHIESGSRGKRRRRSGSGSGRNRWGSRRRRTNGPTGAGTDGRAERRDCGSTHSTCPGFWDVRPTRADRSTATKLRVLTPLKDGSAVYLRYPWDRSEKPLPKFQVLRPLHFPLPTVPHRPTGGTVAIRPIFRITYSLRDRPDGTPRARDRFPPRGAR